jgi:hypothetical protein
VKVLLDENFPLGLARALQSDGLFVEHIITLNWRGAPDIRIRQLLTDTDRVFLTQDDDFLHGPSVNAIIIVSRVRQSRRLADRIAVWRKAIVDLSGVALSSRIFELTDSGVLVPSQGTSP